MKKFSLGIDVGGTKIAYGLFDEHYNMIDKYLIKTKKDLNPDQFIKDTCLDINCILTRNKLEKKDIKGAGFVFPGHVDYEQGLLITTSNIPGFYDHIPFKSIFSEKLDLEIRVDNDANAATLAEHTLGAGKGCQHMIYLTISTGIGGGIIIDNQLFRGNYGAAGEFGHMIIDQNHSHICGCGNRGCAMALASGPSMEKFVIDEINKGRKSQLTDLYFNHTLSCKKIGQSARAGDALALEAIDDCVQVLGILFANLYQIFNINHFVVGGGVAKLGSLLFNGMENHFKKYSKIIHSYPVTIVPSKLGDNAGISGAAMLFA